MNGPSLSFLHQQWKGSPIPIILFIVTSYIGGGCGRLGPRFVSPEELPYNDAAEQYARSQVDLLTEFFSPDRSSRCFDVDPHVGQHKILFYIHGGLYVSPHLLEQIECDILRAGYYPVLIDWHPAHEWRYLEHTLFLRQGISGHHPSDPLGWPRVQVPSSADSISFWHEPGRWPETPIYLLEETARSFGDDPLSIGPLLQYGFDKSRTIEPRSSLAAFLALLAAKVTQEPEKWEVTLVGHGMGAIVLNQVIRDFGDRLPILNIVYLAAACSIRDYQKTVWPYLSAHPKAAFYNLIISDADDRQEIALPGYQNIAPRGSVLMWLDNSMLSSQSPRECTVGHEVKMLRPQSPLKCTSAPGANLLDDFYAPHETILPPAGSTGSQFYKVLGENFRFWEPQCWQSENANSSSCWR